LEYALTGDNHLVFLLNSLVTEFEVVGDEPELELENVLYLKVVELKVDEVYF